MLWTLLPAALATSPVDALDRFLEEAQVSAPEFMVSCGPLERVIEYAALVPIPPGAVDKLSADPAGRVLLSLREPGNAARMGLDLDGHVLMVFDKMKSEATGAAMVLPFSGSPEQVTSLLGALGPVMPGDDGQSWQILSGSGELDVSLAGGQLRVLDRSLARGSVGARTALLDDLPEVEGCAIALKLDEKMGENKLTGEVVAFVPLAGGSPGIVRLALEEPAPPLFAASQRPPSSGSSSERPSVVVSLGVSLNEIIGLMQEVGDIDSAELSMLNEWFTFEPGLVLSMYGDVKAGSFAAVIPLTNAEGQPFNTRRLIRPMKRGLKEQGYPVERVDKEGLVAVVEGRELHIRVAPGRVVAGTHGQAVWEAALGLGEPWVSGSLAAFASEWPVALVATRPEQQVEVLLGLRSRGEAWELSLEAHLPEEMRSPGALGAMAGMAMMAARENFSQMAAKARTAEVHATMAAIHMGQHAHAAETDTFLALSPAPRAPGALDGEGVPWEADASWGKLGLAFDDLRGSYWVEVSSDGADFVVHGMIDADGDGVPAHYQHAMNGELVQTTSPEVR